MAIGLMESMRTEFARALQPFKGGRSGRANIRRASTSYADTGEWINCHFETTQSEDGGVHTYSESGLPAFTIYTDGRLTTPLTSGDRLIIGGRTFEVEYGSYPGNLTPTDQIPAVLR